MPGAIDQKPTSTAVSYIVRDIVNGEYFADDMESIAIATASEVKSCGKFASQDEVDIALAEAVNEGKLKVIGSVYVLTPKGDRDIEFDIGTGCSVEPRW